MSPSLTSAPLASIDQQPTGPNCDLSKQNTITIYTTPINDDHLSAYSAYQINSNSASPSNLDTPAELNSENSGFSDYDYVADDEFFGIDFDAAGEQVIDADRLIVEGAPLPTTELPVVEAYLPQLQTKRAQSSETTTTSTYPMSSNQSSPPSRQSPKIEAIEENITMMSSQFEQSKCVPASQGMLPYDFQATSESTQQTCDQAGNSFTSGDNIGLGVAALIGHSPRFTLTPPWGSAEQQEIRTEPNLQDVPYIGREPHWQDGIQNYTLPDQHVTASYDLQSSRSGSNQLGTSQDQQNAENPDEASGRTGLDPEKREQVSDDPIPNFKDQEAAAQLRLKIAAVEEWRSQAEESTDADDETPNQSNPTLNTPTTSTRPRARSTSAIPESANPPLIKRDPDEVDSVSIRENQLKEGRIYLDPNANGTMNDIDRTLMQELSCWGDGPFYPYITQTTIQAPTAIDAMKRFNDAAETFSVLSRTATWGTRRRSEPSIADIESISNGKFLKRLSFKADKEKRPGGSGSQILNSLTNIVRKTSDSHRFKRSRSPKDGRSRPEARSVAKQEGTLAPPPGSSSAHRGASSPRLNTNVGGPSMSGSSHGATGSTSATASPPKNTLSIVGSVLRRARSGSSLQHGSSKDGIVGMWSKTGGPPVPVLASTPFDNEMKPLEFSDADGEDEDDEEQADDGEVIDFDQAAPVTPNFAGFQEHVTRLYPTIEKSYLVDRIAHQQVVRYKALLQWRVKHSGSIANSNCPAGPHCMALGGSPTLLEPKNPHRGSDASNTGIQVIADASDGDSNPEGVLTAESFPPGVPMPPVPALPAEFECQLCFRVKKFLKPSDWTKHVHEDIQPFTCTYANCKEPKSFKRKADWVRHENERHRRLSWWTCNVDDCSHKCYRKDNFLQHLVREHKIPEPKQKTKAAAKKARNSDEAIWVMIRNCHRETAAKPQDEPCKFCGKQLNSWKKLTVHLAKHMESISLSVWRLVEQQTVNADTIISPVEPLPVRQTPLTPVDRTDRRPSNGSIQYGNLSASISPNVQPMSHFSSPLYPQASPNMQGIPQFSGIMYTQNMGYNTTTASQDMSSYNVPAPIPHHQAGLVFDNNGNPYNQVNPQMDNNQNRGFAVMDHSPSLDQSGFPTVNGTYTPVNPQQGYRSYSSSNQTLSPDPTNFGSGPPQMPGFQAHALTPNQSAYSTSPHHVPSYPSQQMLGVVDENIYRIQSLQTDSGLSYDQISLMRGQDGVVYPPTSTGGYSSYHR